MRDYEMCVFLMTLTLITALMPGIRSNIVGEIMTGKIARTNNLISLCLVTGLGLGGEMFYAKLKSILDSSYD